MIASTCPTCGQKVLKPDPPESIKTPIERIQFEKDWDKRVQEAKTKRQ